jgi:hypothetical protein
MTDPKPPSERDEQQEQEKWYERTRYQILLFAGGIALFGLVLGFVLDWYIDPQTSAQKRDLVQALGLITAGVAGAIGIFFTWRGQRLAREAQEENQQNTQAQLSHAQEELSLTRQGQITDRFTRAIDQLGNASLEIRLGGIYALERIARESEEDHWAIMEVLTAYVRQHAPEPHRNPWWIPEEPEEGQQGEEEAATEKKSREDSRNESEPAEDESETADPLALAPDIRAIMTVLRRRTRSLGHGEPEPLDLHATKLWGVDLGGANFEGADLSGANFWHANLQGVDLQGADLWNAFLMEANLGEANLQGANLSEAYLWENNLSGANLSGANLWATNLWAVDLGGANLSGANFKGANLERANFEEANLERANLGGAKLEGARRLTQAQLEETTGDETTQLPSHLKPPAHWGVKTDEQSEED